MDTRDVLNSSVSVRCEDEPLLPLRDATAQIRLIQVAPVGSNTEIRCTISSWDITNAPAYIAISYVWGSNTKDRNISLYGDGKLKRPMPVSHNCWYALWQAQNVRQETPDAYLCYYWIDAVCINQSDLQEKASQVHIMGDIFRRALFVLGSLGAHADRSELLFRTVFRPASDATYRWRREILGASFTSHDRASPAIDPRKLTLLDVAPRQVDIDNHNVLRAAATAFAKRPFWSRVWILQEYLLATYVVFLCGEHSIVQDDDRRFRAFFDHLDYTPMAKLLCLDIAQMRYLLRDSATEADVLKDLLELTRSRFCADARDRIYSLVKIAGMHKHGDHPLLKPDYTKSCARLAQELVTYFDTKYVDPTYRTPRIYRYCQYILLMVFDCLNVDPDDPELTPTTRERYVSLLDRRNQDNSNKRGPTRPDPYSFWDAHEDVYGNSTSSGTMAPQRRRRSKVSEPLG